MRWVRRLPLFWGLTALGVSVLTGCGGSSPGTAPGPWASATLPLYSGNIKPVVWLQPVGGLGTGTVKGRVTLHGPRPDLRRLEEQLRQQMARHPDGVQCLVAAARDDLPRTPWQIDDKGGVADVFVWVQPPEGSYFKIDMAKKTWPDEVVIDAPSCAFMQRAYVLFPGYRDPLFPQRHLETGQRVVVRNSSTLKHQFRWDDGGPNRGQTPDLRLGGSFTLPVKPTSGLIRLSCAVHPWMAAHARAFEHPFATVTGRDGGYEIPKVPRGVPLRIVAWHEAAGYLTDPNGIETAFRDEENVWNFEVQAPR
jgi:hypothetical protein